MKKRKVFIIGDSISIHYGPYLKQYINYKYDYDRKRNLGIALKDLDNPVGANAGDSKMVLDYLNEQFKCNKKYDILLINCGAHDVRRDRISNEIQVDLQQYKENLTNIVTVAKKMSNKVVWIATTPIIDGVHNVRKVGFLRYEKDIENYNRAAEEIMQKEKINIIHLDNFTKTLGDDIYLDHIHFKDGIRRLQAAFIAGCLEKI